MKLGILLGLMAMVATINPCTISVLIMSIASLLGKSKKPRHVALHTMMYGAGVGLSTLIFGGAAYWTLAHLPTTFTPYVGTAIALGLILTGLVEIKDYFWYGKGPMMKFSTKTEQKIHTWTKKHHSLVRGFGLGIYTTLKLSHYTLVMILGAMYLAAGSLSGGYLSPVIWAVAYCAPILLAGIMVLSGVNTHGALAWKEDSKHRMRMTVGLLYIFTGWVVMLTIAGGTRIG
jgi:MFS family permease